MQGYTCYGILLKELLKRERKYYLFCLFCKKRGKFLPAYLTQIRGDQKVSVHLLSVLQSSGTQKIFDHPV